MEFASCGVGFLASLDKSFKNSILLEGLTALKNVDHRGGSNLQGTLGDGAGIMTSIPFELLGIDAQGSAVASIFAPRNQEKYQKSIEVFEKVFAHYGLHITGYRDVPIERDILDSKALEIMPRLLHAFIKRPGHCRTQSSFDELLYMAKQMVRTRQQEVGIHKEFFFSSLSSRTIVYKALATSHQLEKFYGDLRDPRFKTNFVLFHRRFSTNTLSSWDKVQPFRMIAHNGEINTIAGNKDAAFSREKAIGLRTDQLITHEGCSDSGNLNGMVEALKYRSSIPHLNEILSIMMPPAQAHQSSYFQFWSRAMEPWDGPALVAFSDGKSIGAKLDRNGFRPCRWHQTKDTFYLCSEAGAFPLPAHKILAQGSLHAGRSANIHMLNGSVNFNNPDKTEVNKNAVFDARLTPLDYLESKDTGPKYLQKMPLFYYTKEDLLREIYPMVEKGIGAIGSMGDTARFPAMSDIHRSLYDYFFQDFAQVTNPPLDYLREKLVTEMFVFLGRKPNIFAPKELIPTPPAFRLPGPVMSLGQLEFLNNLAVEDSAQTIKVQTIDIIFDRESASVDFIQAIENKAMEADQAIRNGATTIILSDRRATYEHPPIPALLVMRAVQLKLNALGMRLKTSIIIDSGEIKNAHQIAVLISFGASAVCPYIALDIARFENLSSIAKLFPAQREQRLIKALTDGLMKIMGKMGISVLRSYQGAELFTILGLDGEILKLFFPGHTLYMGGLTIASIHRNILACIEQSKDGQRPHNFIYKEHPKEARGERHSLTSQRAKLAYKIAQTKFSSAGSWELFALYKKQLAEYPINIRHLFALKEKKISLDEVEPAAAILKRFGSGAMSFGSISAEAQRDIIHAFRAFNGRSNSGEGGENPYYFRDGTTASIKQIASGRFGVTAEYLMTSDEIQIKIAQGAKPGEGGQLMGVKVNEQIAQARFSTAGVSLISPPSQHDIYSIEDLKQLIYELKELKPGVRVSVKLVSGKNIGAIALGVVKAGADIIQISGGDGGTGAANLMSMKHAGLPWEIGLLEVHKMLASVDLRRNILLRVDGGLLTGFDIILGAIFGADEFDFGKLSLVAEGCIMARVCEKNTCPTGIATQDAKFKGRYKGKVEEIVNLFTYLAQDVRLELAHLGFTRLQDIIGKTELLKESERFSALIKGNNINLQYFLKYSPHDYFSGQWNDYSINSLNQKIMQAVTEDRQNLLDLSIMSTDRAVPATLAGYLAKAVILQRREAGGVKNLPAGEASYQLNFTGSAGQGFAVFNTHGMHLRLAGEANDSVAKGMAGGQVVIIPHPQASFKSCDNVLVGNACLYGATGGELYIRGRAGDRFCVRNSGALAVIEGAGLHACEYMTGGKAFILGRALENIGAGMTGGELYTLPVNLPNINTDYLRQIPLHEKDHFMIKQTLQKHFKETASLVAKLALAEIDHYLLTLLKFIPH